MTSKTSALIGLISTLAATQNLSAAEVAVMEKVQADIPSINLQDVVRLKNIIEENADILSPQTIAELHLVLESRAVNAYGARPICDILNDECGGFASSEIDVESRLYEVMGPKDQAGH